MNTKNTILKGKIRDLVFNTGEGYGYGNGGGNGYGYGGGYGDE